MDATCRYETLLAWHFLVDAPAFVAAIAMTYQATHTRAGSYPFHITSPLIFPISIDNAYTPVTLGHLYPLLLFSDLIFVKLYWPFIHSIFLWAPSSSGKLSYTKPWDRCHPRLRRLWASEKSPIPRFNEEQKTDLCRSQIRYHALHRCRCWHRTMFHLWGRWTQGSQQLYFIYHFWRNHHRHCLHRSWWAHHSHHHCHCHPLHKQ